MKNEVDYEVDPELADDLMTEDDDLPVSIKLPKFDPYQFEDVDLDDIEGVEDD